MLHITLWDNGEIICDQDCNGLVAAVVKRTDETSRTVTHSSELLVSGNKMACMLGYKALRDHAPQELMDALSETEISLEAAGAAVEKHEPPKKNGETDVKAALMALAELFGKMYGKD